MGKRIPELERAAAEARQHFDGKSGFANEGKINVYACVGKWRKLANDWRGEYYDPCGLRMVTIDREPGVTPFTTRCEGCGGISQSAAYKVDQSITPQFEWYRPDTFPPAAGPATIDHLKRGGLILRRIPTES